MRGVQVEALPLQIRGNLQLAEGRVVAARRNAVELLM